jgi:hypothetical protein
MFLLTYFFFTIKSRWIKIGIPVTFIIFLIVLIKYWHSPSKTFDSIPASIGAIICILFSLIYLYQAASNPQKNIAIFSTSSFWFSMGILIYMAGNLFMFITFNEFERAEAIKLANIIFPLMNILKNIFFSIGMLKKVDE